MKLMTKEKLDLSNIGAAGEHLVLSHLLRRNFVAGQAPYNTKDYDLIVLDRNKNFNFPIQVKTSCYNDGWILKEKHENIINNLFFCFVYLNLSKNDSEIFILDSKTVSKFIKTSHQIWLKLPGKNNRPHKDTPMRLLARNGNIAVGKRKDYEKYLNNDEKKFLKDFSLGWLDKYKDAWDLIK